MSTPILFFSDPHLGLERQSHTTPKSRALLQQAVYEQVLRILRMSADVQYCLGDLFDRATNPESILLQGVTVARECHVLAGNHDSTNRDNRISSLALLKALDETLYWSIITTPRQFVDPFSVYFIPHCLTQTEFEQHLENAPPGDILCLHCNYDSPFAANEATLNLTRERAERLLGKFRHILIGHEHNARSDFDGRLQLLGCTFPTSFHDAHTDKYIWGYDDGQLIPEKVWDASVGFREVPWQTLLAGSDLTGVQFLNITGIAPLNTLPEIAKTLTDTWGQVPGLLMLRNSVQAEGETEGPEVDLTRFQDLPSRVRSELPPDLAPVWEHYLSRVKPT